MAMIQKLGMYGLGGLMMLSVSSCEKFFEKEAEKSKQETLELIDYKKLKLEDYEKLLEGEENAAQKSKYLDPRNFYRIRYWDSIKTDALCKKAYLDGAQMVRDSIAKAKVNHGLGETQQ